MRCLKGRDCSSMTEWLAWVWVPEAQPLPCPVTHTPQGVRGQRQRKREGQRDKARRRERRERLKLKVKPHGSFWFTTWKEIVFTKWKGLETIQSVKGFQYKQEDWSFDALHPCETAGLGGPRHTDPCNSMASKSCQWASGCKPWIRAEVNDSS